MPDIEFKDLKQSIGTELFADTESFLEDLTDDANIVGGFSTGVATIALPQTTVATTIVISDNSPTMTTSVYNPPSGANSGINCTGFYTTVYNPPHRPHPPRPPHRRPIHPTIMTGDV
jgi:hypothetical protein